jgi:hypothetical protein
MLAGSLPDGVTFEGDCDGTANIRRDPPPQAEEETLTSTPFVGNLPSPAGVRCRVRDEAVVVRSIGGTY